VQTGDAANRDYFNVWTSGTQSSPLPLDILEVIAQSSAEVIHTEISMQGYVTRWYIEEGKIAQRMASGKFVLGMDTSEASGKDDISMVLMDVETAEIVAAGTYNETNLITFSTWVCEFLVKHVNVTGIIERRSTGAMLLDYLLLMLPTKGVDPFQRLYNRVVNDYDELPDRYNEIRTPMSRRDPNIYVRYKQTFGFATSGGNGATSRTQLYSTTLQAAAKLAGDRINDKGIIDQVLGLIIKNGRVDHEQGEHDDMVIGWLLCYWLLSLGKNLSYYGLDSMRTLAALSNKSNETPEDAYFRLEQDNLRERISQLYDRLSTEPDEFICQRLEHELRLMDRKVVLRDNEIYSVDELIRTAIEKRKTRRKASQHSLPSVGYEAPSRYQALHGYFSDGPPPGMNYHGNYR
jgi:hypothetical protein